MMFGLSVCGGTLTWNGGAVGVWDATTPNWRDADGRTVAWQAGESAVIPAGALVDVRDVLRVGGVQLGGGAVVAGPGQLLATGALEVPAGSASFAVSVWAAGDLAKTGAGTLAMNALTGPLHVDAGVLAMGGLHAARAVVTENGGSRVWWTSDPTADNLVANGSFEDGPTAVTDYTYVKGDAMPYGWVNDTNYFVLLTTKGMGSWSNTGAGGTDKIPDGNLVAGIQLGGCAAQTLSVPADGFYELSYTSFRRTNSQNGNHLLDIQFDDVTRAVVRTVWMAGSWRRVASGPVWLTAGTHVLKLAGEGNWDDSTSFVDQVELRACTTGEAPAPEAVEDFVADGNLAVPPPPVTSDADGNHYLTQPGSGTSAFAEQVSFKGRFYVTTGGRLTFNGPLVGTENDSWIYKEGPGTLVVQGGMEKFVYHVEEGRTEIKLTSPLWPRIRTHVGRPASFYYDLNGGNVAISGRVHVQGSAPVTFGTLGTGDSGVMTDFFGLTVPCFTIDIGAGDVFQCKNLYQPLLGGNKYFCPSAFVKDGPGTFRVTENVGPNDHPLDGPVTVRNGTYEFTVQDLPLNGTHPWLGTVHAKQPAFGVFDRTLVLGDAQTPADAALCLRAAADGVVSTRVLEVRAFGASATLTGGAGRTGFLGTIRLARAETRAVAVEGGVLHLGTLAKAADFDGTPVVACQGAVTVDAADGQVALVSSDSLQATRVGGAAVPVASLDVAGRLAVVFDGMGRPGVFSAGALKLGPTEVMLVDGVQGGVFAASGTYVIATYDTLELPAGQSLTDVLTIAGEAQQAGLTYAFAAAEGQLTLTIRAQADNPVFTWAQTGGGDWATATNWDHGAAPNGVDHEAQLGRAAQTAAEVAVAAETKLHALAFDNANGYTVTGGTLAFAAKDGEPAQIQAAVGTHTVKSTVASVDGGAVEVSARPGAQVILDGALTAPVAVTTGRVGLGSDVQLGSSFTTGPESTLVLAGDLTFGSEALTIGGGLAGAGRLTKTGSGTLAFGGVSSADRSFAGTLAVEAGTLAMSEPYLPSATAELGPYGQLTADAAQHGLSASFYRMTQQNAATVKTVYEPLLLQSFEAFKSQAVKGALLTNLVIRGVSSGAFGLFDSAKDEPTLPAGCREDAGTNDKDFWAAVLEGTLLAPESGRYTFAVYPDDAFVLSLDGQNFMQGTNVLWWTVREIDLTKGPHRVGLGLVENTSQSELTIQVKAPGETAFRPLPANWLVPDLGVARLAGTGALTPKADSVLVVGQPTGFGVFAGTLAGERDSTLVALLNGILGIPAWTGGNVYLAQGELAVGAAGRAMASLANGSPSGTLNVLGPERVENVYGAGKVCFGAHLYVSGVSSEANCGLSADKTYTHLVSFPRSGANATTPTVNGVTFNGLGACTVENEPPSNMKQGAMGGLDALFQSFAYDSTNYTIKLTGLAPGTLNDFRFYWYSWGVGSGGNGKRNGTFTFLGKDDHGVYGPLQTYTFDLEGSFPGRGSKAVVGCRYIVPSDGCLDVRVESGTKADTVHCYAFSNELLGTTVCTPTPVTLAPGAGAVARQAGEFDSTSPVVLEGDGTQAFAGKVVLADPLAVKRGTLLLEKGANVNQPVTLDVGTKVVLRGGASVAGLAGEAGELDLQWGDPRPYGALQADGTFAALGDFRVTPFTCDEDSGYTPSKDYLLAFNYKIGEDQLAVTAVNEVLFKESSPTAASGLGYPYYEARTGAYLYGIPWTPHAGGNDGHYVMDPSNSLYGILHAMSYAGGQKGNDQQCTIGGLTKGKTYELRLLGRRWDPATAGVRLVQFSFDPAGTDDMNVKETVAVDGQGELPYYIALRFTANGPKFHWRHLSLNGDTWHLYGASVEEADPAVNIRTLAPAEDAVFGGSVHGLGELVKAGAGTLTLTGPVDAAGFWSVQAGGLVLSDPAQTVANVAVAGGASFGGRGRVTGDLGVAANGTLALGTDERQGGLVVEGALAVGEGATVALKPLAGTTACAARTAVLPSALTIREGASAGLRCVLFRAEESDFTGLSFENWKVYKANGQVDRAARLMVTPDGHSIVFSSDRATTLFFR